MSSPFLHTPLHLCTYYSHPKNKSLSGGPTHGQSKSRNKSSHYPHASLLKGTDADPFTAGPKYFSEEDDEIPAIRQSSMYNEKNRARIDNNQFFESRSNPLSSKGN